MAGVTITGVAPVADNTMVHKLVETINQAGAGLQATVEHSKAGPNNQEFQVKIDLVRQPREKYTTVLKVPPPLRADGAGIGGGAGFGKGGFGNGAFGNQGDNP